MLVHICIILHIYILLYGECQIASYHNTIIVPQYQLKEPNGFQIANTAQHYIIYQNINIFDMTNLNNTDKESVYALPITNQ